jgi:outer membrane protein TolC
VDKEMPNLNVYIESALKNSPLLQLSDKQIIQIFEQIKKEKKSWTDFIFVDANAKYGLYNQVLINDAEATGGEVSGIKSNKEQFNYFLGISVRIPISKITSKGNDLKILNESLEAKKLEREQVESEIKRLVTEEYFNLNYLYKSMKINQDMLQAFAVNLLKSEKDLQSGLISLEEYNSMVVQKGKVEDSFYKIQNEFFSQYKKLEILTGINKKETK